MDVSLEIDIAWHFMIEEKINLNNSSQLKTISSIGKY
jgi:hypothetical protein